MNNRDSAVMGAVLMLAFILFLSIAYVTGKRHGRQEVYIEATEHGKGQRSVVGDDDSKYQWFKN